jgi:hypothetical protein
MIIWKGKGIMIFLYFIVSVIAIAVLNSLIIENLGIGKAPIEVFMGLVLIVTGIWTRLTAEDYYIDKEGRKKYLEIENELFFIKMSVWGLILPTIGVGLTIWGLINSF